MIRAETRTNRAVDGPLPQRDHETAVVRTRGDHKPAMGEIGYETSPIVMTDAETKDRRVLRLRGRVPGHVVYRDFVNETVVLNLKTGTYHGLNPTGGRMLQAVEHADSLADALQRLARDYGWDSSDVEADLVALCTELENRDLLELTDLD